MADIFWSAVLTSTVLGASTIALSIQSAIERRSKEQAVGLDVENDTSDICHPFSDSERQKRLVPLTLIIAAWNLGIPLFECQDTHQGDPAVDIPTVRLIQLACLVLGWLYALALAILSHNYRLPNKWGWTLNVHLCVFYFVTFLGSSYSLGRLFLLPSDATSLYKVTAFSVWMIHFDLLFVTSTTRRGPLSLDKDGRPVQTVTTCSVLDIVTYLWVYSMVNIAQVGRHLEDEDLPALPQRNRARVLFQKMKQSRRMGIVKRLILVNALPITGQFTAAAIASALRYAPPYIMNQILLLLTSMEKGETERDEISLATAYGYIAGLFTITVIHECIDMRIWHNGMIGDLCTRGALFMELYAKTLRKLNIATPNENLANGSGNDKNGDGGLPKAKEKLSKTIGSIVNLMSTDTMRVASFFGVSHEIVRSPVELTVAIAFLYQLLGPSCYLGLFILLISLPLNQYVVKLNSVTQKGLMETRDQRIGTTNEIIQGIRQVKFFAWETRWCERIMAQRKEELSQLRNIAISRLVFNVVWQGSPLFVSVVSLWSYTKLAGNELTAATAFTALLVFEELRTALNVLPHWMADVTQVLVSLNRIDAYLSAEELDRSPTVSVENHTCIGLEDATISWNSLESIYDASRASSPSSADDIFALRNVSLDFPTYQLSIICGPTGSGKTLLMLGLLGEAVVMKGKVFCPRSQVSEDTSVDLENLEVSEDNWILEKSIAYVAQNPWLQNASIRENIIFGLPFSKQRYDSVIKSCALVHDLAQFPDSDQTEIGEKGITLSGGQKARVALARAVYSRAQHVLMDDVLSAVDAYTARQIYEQCIIGPLFKNRTRILITHHVRLCIKGASNIVLIENGEIKISGSITEFGESSQLQKILHHEDEAIENETIKSEGLTRTLVEAPKSLDVGHALIATPNKPKTLIDIEKRAQGYVKARLYIKYCKAFGSVLFWSILAFVFLFTRGLTIGASFWIKKWTDDTAKQEFEHIKNENENDTQSVDYYIRVYALLTLAQLVFNILRIALVYVGSLRAGRLLFTEMLICVFGAPLRFFDTTPVGRILNRFAKDIETVDSNLPNYIVEFLVAVINVVSVLVLIGVTIPWLTAPLIITLAFYFYVGKLFMNAGLQYRRLESITRSPIFTHFTETIAGVTTIRAFGKSKLFLSKMVELADKNCRPCFNVYIINRWITFVLLIMSAVLTSLIALVCLLYPDQFPAAVAALCMSYSLTFTAQVFDLIRRSTSVQLSFNAVERVVEYTEIQQEAPAIVHPRPPSTWPSEGRIEFTNLHARYAPDLETVLHGVSFQVKPREKIGIVGRTGSGKSTIALSIFRFIEAYQGSIIIDDINIANIGTSDLRSYMSIIPQDPTLFSGSLRTNLDPFSTFTDADIFLALKRVHLLPNAGDEDTSSAEFGNINSFYNLDTPVSQGGHNFSQGQRQLLCLARALLQRRSILIMDEATASVDFRTDEAIQHTISTEFKECTILCIAHRLLTVVEYDRILVLDQGHVIEFANPYELLNDVGSKFYQMCKASGEFNRLLTMAKSKHQLVDV